MRPVYTLAAIPILIAAWPAQAEEADLSDAIAKVPGYTLRDLLPTAIVDAITDPFGLQVEAMSNEPDRPFQVSFDIAIPDYPNVSMTLVVSERERVTDLVSNVLSMAAEGRLPGDLQADPVAFGEWNCVGVVDQLMVNCMFGTAGVQFATNDYLDGGSIDYAATRQLFETLPVEIYQKVFGQ